MVKLGTNLPEHLIGTDHGALAEFLSGIEELGYGYITIGDHVLGADLSVRPDWKPYLGKAPLYDQHMPWHDPLVLFGFIAALTTPLEMSTGILIAPQRQAALLAKQAAEVDILSEGRLRLVIAAGWNDVEFEALGVNFADRGKIMVEQVELMRQLWTQEVVDYSGKFHTVTAAGINPLPVQRPIPLWFGGESPVVLSDRRLADGWFPYYSSFDPVKLTEDLGVIHEVARGAGRDPSEIEIEGAVFSTTTASMSPTLAADAADHARRCVEYAANWWKDFGATHYWVTAPWANLGPEETGVRVPGKKWSGVEQRLDALREFKDTIGPDF